jgi:hypothetical protein
MRAGLDRAGNRLIVSGIVEVRFRVTTSAQNLFMLINVFFIEQVLAVPHFGVVLVSVTGKNKCDKYINA